MSYRINKDKFQEIEESFMRLRSNERDTNALGKMSSALSALTGKTIVVDTVAPTAKNQECFVMSVYPEESDLQKMVNAIVAEEKDHVLQDIWNSAAKWYVEIDTRILQREVDLTDRELTALVLHEIGHIVYSNSVPMKVAKIVKLEYAKTPMVTKNLVRDTFFSRLLVFPILYACNVDKNKKGYKEEIKADKYSVNAGYGEDLASAMDKIIIYAGTDVKSDKAMGDLMGFSIESILQLQERREDITRRNMMKMVAGTPSRIARNTFENIRKSISANPNSLGVTEATVDNLIQKKVARATDAVMQEFTIGVHKMKRIDPADLDYIAVEMSNIRTNDDRMLLISYIYSKIETIDYYIALIDSKNPKYVIPHSRDALVQMKQRLEGYRKNILGMKLPELSYQVNVGYPEGYEG